MYEIKGQDSDMVLDKAHEIWDARRRACKLSAIPVHIERDGVKIMSYFNNRPIPFIEDLKVILPKNEKVVYKFKV